MRTLALCALALLSGSVSGYSRQTRAVGDIAGTWELTTTRFGEPSTNRVHLEVAGEKVTGRSGNLKLEGTLRGAKLEFQVRSRDGNLFGTFSGELGDGEIRGEATLDGSPAAWSARRAAARPAAPRTHAFEPVEFHRFFSSTIPPVLRIFPGDTVTTWSVDAGGTDAQGKRRSLGGNPLTGPFYVEGALPGDTLVVKLNRVRLNRASAGSGAQIVASALTPQYLRRAKFDDNFDSDWKLDLERGVARLAKPTERLKNFTVKLAPMLGCVGVAPPGRESFRSGNLGPWGGNMDYNQIREGTTLYLPVFQPGALLFVGDGHAAQGDGELTGDALETSMQIEFTVDVIEEQSSATPRAENAEFVMALGIARSVPEAIQTATSQLATWLEREHGLSSNEAAVVLGFAIRYDIAELVDPQVHVVAKLPKGVLAQIGKPQGAK